MRTGVDSLRTGNDVPAEVRRRSSGTHLQWLVESVADAKHPLVAAHRAHAAPHLIGQGLKRQSMIGRSQRAG
jgi:hypothetical protein